MDELNIKDIETGVKTNKYVLVKNGKGKSECWKLFRFIKDPISNSVLFGLACCSKCGKCIISKKDVDGVIKEYGTKNLTDHMKVCAPPLKRGKSEQSTLPFKRVSKVRNADLDEIRKCVSELVAGAHLPFNVVDNIYFRDFAQKLVKLGATHGNIDVNSVLVGRKTVNSDCIKMVERVKNNIKYFLQSAIEEQAVSFTTDLWTDNIVQRSYLDITFFWIEEGGTDKSCWSLNHAMYSCAHFPERKTAHNIANVLNATLREVGCDETNTPVTTDKGSNIVAATEHNVHIDCACHRLNTAVSTAWEKCKEMESISELDQYAHNLVTYVKKTTGIQLELNISLKHGGKTRPWRSLQKMFTSILQNHTTDGKLRVMLRDRGKEYLLDSINLNLLNQTVEFLDPMSIVFDMLEFAYMPTLQNVLPAFYLLRNQWDAKKDCDLVEIRRMRRIFVHQLDQKMWSSIAAIHFCATLLDPSLKAFSFVPVQKATDRKAMMDQALNCIREYAVSVITSMNSSNQLLYAEEDSSLNIAEPSSHVSEHVKLKLETDPFASFRQGDVEAITQTVNVALFCSEDLDVELKRYQTTVGPFVTP